MEEVFERIAGALDADYVEFRYHRRISTSIRYANGEFEDFSRREKAGVGVRVLRSGSWGFSNTNDTSPEAVREAAEKAYRMAGALGEGGARLAEARFFRGEYVTPGFEGLLEEPLEEKARFVLDLYKVDRPGSVKSVTVIYRELLDERHVWNTDGANARSREARPEYIVFATAMEGGETYVRWDGNGVLGGRGDLLSLGDPVELSRTVVSEAGALVTAPRPRGGKYRLILSPSIVGLLSHEAIGHTVEADLVESGSAVSGKLGQRVASPIINLVDSGLEMPGSPPGTIIFDDEGVIASRTYVIREGVLRSYLTDRERAARLGIEPTGNARAWDHSVPPIVRMRNTYIEPGDWTLEELIEDTEEGYLLEGGGGGQADANAEFFFSIQKVKRIEKGEIAATLRGTAITGQAFEVLSSADAATREWSMSMNTGHCGKIQPAKVAGGGPYLRVVAQLAGVSG
ncbi:MAG: TldD/PmbA family protein [Thermoplasmata archaeon]|nr:MAG: TldD/PmbA family protein [Thermoplasmata archaeon]